MGGQSHTAGLRRGYADNLRVAWERPGKGGHSCITLLNAKRRPVAVLLGDYVPGVLDADMEAAANLFCASPELLKVAASAYVYGVEDEHDIYLVVMGVEIVRAPLNSPIGIALQRFEAERSAAIAKATGEASA